MYTSVSSGIVAYSIVRNTLQFYFSASPGRCPMQRFLTLYVPILNGEVGEREDRRSCKFNQHEIENHSYCYYINSELKLSDYK